MRKIIAEKISLPVAEQMMKGQIKALLTSFKNSNQDESGCMFKLLINFNKGGETEVTIIRELSSHFGEKI